MPHVWSPVRVIGYFNWPNPSSRTMALGLTQPLTEMSTRNLPRHLWANCLQSTSRSPVGLHGLLKWIAFTFTPQGSSVNTVTGVWVEQSRFSSQQGQRLFTTHSSLLCCHYGTTFPMLKVDCSHHLVLVLRMCGAVQPFIHHVVVLNVFSQMQKNNLSACSATECVLFSN
jgi:hypothetical protein